MTQSKLRLPTRARFNRFAVPLCGVFTATLLFVDNARAVEPWADPRMQVSEGLIGWYDAPRLAQFRQAAGGAAPKNGERLDRWPDASGRKRDLLQAGVPEQPAFLTTDALQAIRFDGRAAHFRLTNEGDVSPAMTIFVVAVPNANSESFTGFLAAAGKGQNDYVSGFCLDLGGYPTQLVKTINVEGQGQQGVTNLLIDTAPFGELLRICVTTAPGPEETSLWVNGRPQGRRARAEATQIRRDELVVGARFYNNGGPADVRGFFAGDIAEVLLYDRMLSARERASVEKYLAAKYAHIKALPVPVGSVDANALVRVADPPPIQVLVPGFEVRQLPVELKNINNLLYRPDGKLVALGYDGNIYLLSDSDGDGLEDKAALYWENKGRLRGPIGMALLPPRTGQPGGVVVAAKGKCALLVDTEGDDRLDREQIIASGWTELPHGVDALGVAVDPRDGSVYFGLGVQDYTDAYGTGSKQAIPYSLSSERATIMRIAPDFKSRSVVATGIRFSVAIRLNRAGDLFCTDQEGATWLPNGNPFDELLHVEKGRHYGFPPRHPQLLPNVIDEPSTFDYVPQHQSTCGLNFNDPAAGGAAFGPTWWQSDALVTGYSRGKLYRTKLVKTPTGYVAQNQLLACLSMLPADVCVSPTGSAVVALHSGGPDWGSGPNGDGKLFQIRALPKTPRPVAAWAQSSREVHVAFDLPLTSEQLVGLPTGTSIEYGQAVAAGDRFESQWPGYKAVQDQMLSQRGKLEVQNVQVSPDRKTLILATAAHPSAANYAITLKGLGRPATAAIAAPQLRQAPETDVAYSLEGVLASWQGQGAAQAALWLPHLDTQVARELTEPSQEHGEFWRAARGRGMLTLRTTLELENMLRPQVQPGSRIDYQLPAEKVTVTFRFPSPFSVVAADRTLAAQQERGQGEYVVSTVATAARLPVEVSLPTGQSPADLRVSWSTAEDARERPFPLRRFILPWAPTTKEDRPALLATDLPALQGGNWPRGKAIFLSEQATCAKCHAVRGEGGAVGPDLSNLPHRDYESVLRDITSPSFAINPDFISQNVVLSDGRVLTGPVRTSGESLLISDDKGKVTTAAKSDVEEISTAKISVMPEGLPKQLGPEKMKDLLTFLLADPPRMPDYGPEKLPEPRSKADVAAVLQGSVSQVTHKPLKIVLVSGPKDHGPGEHDYPAWRTVWSRLLKMADNVQVGVADDWPSADDLATAGVIVFYQQGKWTPERAKDIDAYLARGGGLVYLHYAVDGGADAPGFAQRIGLAWQGGRSKFRHGLIDLGFQTGAGHPISRNFGKVQFHDESYWQLVGDPAKTTLLASGAEDGSEQPLFWTVEPGKGRVFVSILGHFAWTFDDPLFRVVLLRSIAWSAREPIDRFNDLVTPGARMGN